LNDLEWASIGFDELEGEAIGDFYGTAETLRCGGEGEVNHEDTKKRRWREGAEMPNDG
jgi:hypothetical protein